ASARGQPVKDDLRVPLREGHNVHAGDLVEIVGEANILRAPELFPGPYADRLRDIVGTLRPLRRGDDDVGGICRVRSLFVARRIRAGLLPHANDERAGGVDSHRETRIHQQALGGLLSRQGSAYCGRRAPAHGLGSEEDVRAGLTRQLAERVGERLRRNVYAVR
ncbi:hypothetical protein QU38_02220, partial [Staphylococcus aureus]